MRYFIAIDFPQKIVEELLQIQQKMKKLNLFDGKFVEAENLHLTLRFLGELNNEKLSEITNSLQAVFFNSFDMRLGDLGVFVPECPRVLWVDLRGEEIYSLQKQIEWAVNPFIAPEEKPFVSHITLARIKHVYNIYKLMRIIEEMNVEPLTFFVDKFILKQSELTPDGPIYYDVACYPAKNL